MDSARLRGRALRVRAMRLERHGEPLAALRSGQMTGAAVLIP